MSNEIRSLPAKLLAESQRLNCALSGFQRLAEAFGEQFWRACAYSSAWLCARQGRGGCADSGVGSRALPCEDVSWYVVSKHGFRGRSWCEERVVCMVRGPRRSEKATCPYIAREIWLGLFSISVLYLDGF